MKGPQSFYLLTLGTVSLMAFLLILLLLSFVRKTTKKTDKSLLFLSLFLICWTASTYLLVFLPHTRDYGVNDALSIANNAFLLLAATHFDYTPRWLIFFRTRKSWVSAVKITFSLLIFLKLIFLENSVANQIYVIIDLITTTFAIIFLGFTVYETFKSRGISAVGRIAGVIFLLALVVQIMSSIMDLNQTIAELTFGAADDYPRLFIALVTKLLFIAVLLIVSIGWSYELFLLPRPEQMNFELSGNNGKIELILSVHPILIDARISIPSSSKKKAFKLLAKFAQCRKFGKSDLDQFLMVAPRGVTKKKLPKRLYDRYDFYDHNEISRIMKLINENISSGIKKRDLETKELFDRVYPGKYMLRVFPQNIIIHHATLIDLDISFKGCFEKCPSNSDRLQNEG